MIEPGILKMRASFGTMDDFEFDFFFLTNLNDWCFGSCFGKVYMNHETVPVPKLY